MRHPVNGGDQIKKTKGTAAFSKFIRILQLVADSEDPRSITNLTKLSGFPRTTVHRTVAGLVDEGLLVESLTGDGYVLGSRLIELASKSWGRSELRVATVEELKHLRDVTEEAVHLAVPSGLGMVYIEKLESPKAVQMSSRIGTSVMLHSSSVGKAYLACLDKAACEALLARLELRRHTPKTICDPGKIREQLEQVRQNGWAVDDEENETGISCFGAPIRDESGQAVAAISVSTLCFRQKPNPVDAYIKPLLAACESISQIISGISQHEIS